jgi:hypothetical protein
MAREFLDKEYERALGIFKAAVIEMRGTHSQNPKIIDGKKTLYEAKTLSEFRAAAELFRNTSTSNKRISMAKKLLFKAAAICAEADDGVGLHFDAQKPAPEAAPAPPAPPDVARAKLSAPAALSPLDKTHRVVLSAADPVKVKTEPVDVPAADAGSTRPIACVSQKAPASPVCISSDDEAGQPGKAADSKQPKTTKDSDDENEVVYAWQMGSCDNGFNDLIVAAMQNLTKLGKCAGFDELDQDATDQLRTLPVLHAELLLSKVRDETEKIRNISAYIVKHGEKIRHQWGIACVEDIYDEIEREFKATYDISNDEDDEDDEADDATPDGKIAYACDLDGNWTAAVVNVMMKLDKHGAYNFTKMSGDATEELQTLPEDLTLDILKQLLRKEDEIDDANAFVVENAQELRAHHGIDAPAAVRQKMRDDNEAGAPSAYDSQGNSIEY